MCLDHFNRQIFLYVAILQQSFFILQGHVFHRLYHKAIYYTFILTGTVLATSCFCLDMTCTAKNITKNDDVEIKELRHTADLPYT